jgi:hypothetical protein
MGFLIFRSSCKEPIGRFALGGNRAPASRSLAATCIPVSSNCFGTDFLRVDGSRLLAYRHQGRNDLEFWKTKKPVHEKSVVQATRGAGDLSSAPFQAAKTVIFNV